MSTGKLLDNVPAEALGAWMAAGGDVCLGQSGYFDRNSKEVDLMKFDLDELEQAAFEATAISRPTASSSMSRAAT